MTTKSARKLVSSVLSLMADGDHASIEDAIAYAHENLSGPERDHVLAILKLLISDRMTVAERPVQTPAADPQIESVLEVQAILSDLTFNITKSELNSVINKIIGTEANPIRTRDSVQDARRKAYLLVRQLPPAQQSAFLRAIRPRYIKERRSTLKDWSNAIQGD